MSGQGMAKTTVNRGFSLVELLVTIAVASIFIAVAIPGFHSIRQNNQAVTLSNNVSAGLVYARSEAIKRGRSVSICGAATSAQTACGNGNSWSEGWIIFTDPNGSGAIDVGDEIVKVGKAPALGSTITAPNTVVTFSANGFVTAGSGDFSLTAPGCKGQHGRTVTISNTGRLSIQATACSS